ncbi:MAG: serine hydrolase [Slackia faecicanis]|nr:serine hydrolase [Slackia faecicanis]
MTDENRRRANTPATDGFDEEARARAREHLRQRQEAEKGHHGGPAHAARDTRTGAVRTQARRAQKAASDMASRTMAGARSATKAATGLPKGVLAIAAAVAIALVGFAVFQCTRPADEPSAEPVSAVSDAEASGKEQASAEPEPVEFEPSPAALDGVPAESGLQAFALAGDDTPVISDDQSTAIMKAVDAAEEHGDVSMVFYSLETGKGISYDADTTVYGASSFKAPYALYVCQTQVDTGKIELDDSCQGTDAYDPNSYYNGGSYPLSDLIADAIVYSDNNAFGSLRDAFDSEGYDEWADELGLDDVHYRADSWYPWYCARTSAKVWTEMYSYLQTPGEAAQMLNELTSQTEVSFIREALRTTGASVQDKAGWCADADPLWNGVCDAGIVSLDGKAYILSVMTGMPDGDTSYALYEDIASAVFDTRDALA